MSKFYSGLLAAILFFQSSHGVAVEPNCDVFASRDMKETAIIFGQTKEYIRIPKSQLRRGTLFSYKLNNPKAIYIGLNGGGGHAYLVAGDYRYDGNLWRMSPTLRNGTPVFNEGVVIEISDETGQLRKKIVDYFEKYGAPRAMSCAKGVCAVVNDAQGFRMGGNTLNAYRTDSLMQQLLQDAATDSEGRTLKKQLFLLGDMQAEPYFTTLQQALDDFIKYNVKPVVNLGVEFALQGTLATLGILAVVFSKVTFTP